MELLEIQKKMHELRVMMLEIDELTRKRDTAFFKIVKELSKFTKIDLVKRLEKDKRDFYSKGLHWTSEESLQWLILWFDQISKEIK